VAPLTIDSLKRILRDDVGVPEGADLDGEILDVSFANLGYDSLAMLQIILAIQQRYGVSLPDEAMGEMKTPQAAINYVNGLLVGS
jgi:act minimal PKS acyl carrier protein